MNDQLKLRLPCIVLAVMLAAMAALMLGPMRDETATVDETTFMGGGYGYFKTGACYMAEENPLLLQMIVAAPMLFQDVQESEMARALMEGRAHWLVGLRWNGPMEQLPRLFPTGVDWRRYQVAVSPYLGQVAVTSDVPPAERDRLWYRVRIGEAQEFGRILVYDPRNNAARLIFWSRFTMLLMTLATGAFVFVWTRQLTENAWAGAMAAALWVFNPIALGYGHLAITEPGITLALPVAVWWFAKTMREPVGRNVFLAGVFTALAIQMKFLALMLGPVFVVLLAIQWWRERRIAPAKMLLKWLVVSALGFWVTMLVVYFPHWWPPPAVDAQQAELLGVPGWFQSLRPLLIPGECVKAVALKLQHAKGGQDAFLCGEWRKMGWWYYYPLAMWFKTPLPLLALIVMGAGLILRNVFRKPVAPKKALPQNETVAFASLVPWVAAAVYLLTAMTSKIDIGVRHVIPVYPLLAVGIADQLARMNRRWQIAAWLGCAWLVVVTAFAWPDFLPYCNEFAGGTANGYKVLIDSNYDWGQDGKRLKKWMVENNVEQVYLDFFGTQPAIEWHKIAAQRVSAQTAQQIKQGYLVVSASNLLRPEWDWLRQQHQPAARIGYTLFVYRFP